MDSMEIKIQPSTLSRANIAIDYIGHDDVTKWKVFRVTNPLWEEFTGHWWIPPTKASDTEL